MVVTESKFDRLCDYRTCVLCIQKIFIAYHKLGRNIIGDIMELHVAPLTNLDNGKISLQREELASLCKNIYFPYLC